MPGIARVITHDRQCPVCCGPARIPTGFEMDLVRRTVEAARDDVEVALCRVKAQVPQAAGQDLNEVLAPLVVQAKLQGEQEARLRLVEVN